ncbi:MAG: cystathionine beta-synthase, partial [Bacteroidetes bacterium]|nr:cystathionine beta-synthase [Bacteroidota bacterium]
LTDKILLSKIVHEPNLKQQKVKDVMDAPFNFVGLNNTLDVLSSVLKDQHQAVMVRDENNQPHIITQHDILRTLMEK